MFSSGIFDAGANKSDNTKWDRCPENISERRENVKYGKVVHDTYYSTTCGMDRGFNILLPDDYSEEKEYPVLYLLHGIFGDENSFFGDPNGRINEIVTNMAVDGIISETIVVTPNMFAATDLNQQPGFTMEACIPYDNFINDLTVDLMPYIEDKYPVLKGRENTYLAGFSMGGRETLYITLQRPELFGYVCAISSAPGLVPGKDRFMVHEGTIATEDMRFKEGATEPEKLILCCGDHDSVVGDFPRSYHEILTNHNINHIWYVVSESDHDNNAVMSGVYNLLLSVSESKNGI